MTYKPECKLVTGEFYIAPGKAEGKMWIGREKGRNAGEGGDFSTVGIDNLLREHYEKNF